MSSKSQDERDESDSRGAESPNGNPSDPRPEPDLETNVTLPNQYLVVHPSDSDTVINKSDSDDGLFITDSSDDVMNDVLSDFSNVNERLEQTRETIMESLAQSFVSLTPHNQDSNFNERNETKIEQRSQNHRSVYDETDKATVQQDMQVMHGMAPMRRIPSDSAFPNLRRNLSEELLASNAASEEYVTIGSHSDEPTTVSFFSQNTSTNQLAVVTRTRSYVACHSASSFHVDQTTKAEEKRPTSAQSPAHVESWLISDSWLHNNDDEVRQDRISVDSENTKSSAGFVHDVDAEPYPQPVPHPKPRQINKGNSPAFGPSKLPRFYHHKSPHKTTSSRSESCVLPTQEKAPTRTAGSMSARRSQSSSVKASLMARSTASERNVKKDAGGVSYALKHLSSPAPPSDRTSSKKTRGADKARAGSRSPGRSYSKSPPRQTRPVTPGVTSKPEHSAPESTPQGHEMYDGNCARNLPHYPQTGSEFNHSQNFNEPDAAPEGHENRDAPASHAYRSNSAPKHSVNHDPKASKKMRPGSLTKASTNKSNKTSLSTGKPAFKVQSSVQPKSSVSRSQATGNSTDSADSAIAGTNRTCDAEVETAPVTSDSIKIHPSVMSLKVDVSVRAEDGSVHNFCDLSPERNSRSVDLFSGVEEFIRDLLEGSGAIPSGTSGQGPTTTPVSGVSPRGSCLPEASLRSPPSYSDRAPSGNPTRPSNGEVPSEPQNSNAGETRHRQHLSKPDTRAQRFQTEESLLLTSTGSMSSSDVQTNAAKHPAYSGCPGRLNVSSHSNHPAVSQRPIPTTSCEGATANSFTAYRLEEGRTFGDDSAGKNHSAAASNVFYNKTSEDRSEKCPDSALSAQHVRSSTSISPQRLKSLSPSPERRSRLSPRSRIPVAKRRLSSESVTSNLYGSRSPTPERTSFYHTAQTTPEQQRSASPSSLCSVGSSSLSSVTRLVNSHEQRALKISSPVARTSPTNVKGFIGCRSRSASPRSNRASELRQKSCEHVRGRPAIHRYVIQPITDSLNEVTMELEYHPPEEGSGNEIVRAILVNSRDIKNICDESISGAAVGSPTEDNQDMKEQNYSVECTDLPDVPHAGGSPAPTPAKRSYPGVSVSFQNEQRAPPVPQKRQKATAPPTRSTTPHSLHEDLMISSRTSFCSVNSPRRDRSRSPMRSTTPANNNSGLGFLWLADIANDAPQTSPNPEQNREEGRDQEGVQRPNYLDDGETPDLERELIGTENTLRLMEETISVLERQNQSLATNTREISVKLDQEKSRRCDLKTAKLMLQRVRRDLQKSTKNSEQKRMEMFSAKQRIAEQDSIIFLLKESLREESHRNKAMEEYFRQASTTSGNLMSPPNLRPPPDQPRQDCPASSLFTEPGSVRLLLAETEAALREERRRREDAETKLAEEISRKQRIVDAARKWKEQLSEPAVQPDVLESKCTERNLDVEVTAATSENGSSQKKSYQSFHSDGQGNSSAVNEPKKSQSKESLQSGDNFDIESASGSDYVCSSATGKRDCSCQCDALDGTSFWKEKYEEERQNHELCASKLNSISLERTDLKSQLDLVDRKLNETASKKERLEQELKGLIDKIHEMQRDVQLYQHQSAEQLAVALQGGHDLNENIEMEKIKLREYYQQQVETIVQEKVTEFQGKVSQLEKIVRDQINTYTKSMQQKFREKLTTASLQQKEVISRLEMEHCKELERLTGEYPQEMSRLQKCLADCREEIADKRSRLEQRETQVGTILRVVKLLIREGNAMKGDRAETQEQNTLEIARKILRCMDLDLDDIISPRPCRQSCKDQTRDGEPTVKDGSCVTFRSIPDSPRPVAANRNMQSKNAPPVPPRRRLTSHINETTAMLTEKKSDHSTTSQTFDLSPPNEPQQEDKGAIPAPPKQRKLSYTRFGDEVLRARSDDLLQKSSTTPGKQLATISDLTVWGDSGSWTVDGAPPMAPPPTPPSVTTSTGTNTDEAEPQTRESVQDVASSVMQAISQSPRAKRLVDKATGSASNLSAEPWFLPLSNAFLAEEANEVCQCKRLRRAMEAYKRLGMGAGRTKKPAEAPGPRTFTRSSSETSIQRLVSNVAEAGSTASFQAKKHLSKSSLTKRTSIERNTGTKQLDVTATNSRTSSESNQLFIKEVRKTLTARAAENGGVFSNPFSMKPMPSNRSNAAGLKITSKPPLQRAQSPSPSRSATAQSPSPVRPEKRGEEAAGGASSQPEASRSRSRQDATEKSPFVERTISPSKGVVSRCKALSPSPKKMPTFDKADKIDGKESSDDSKFALKSSLLTRPRDNRLSAQRKQLAAAARKPAARERHSVSPRERKLFTLRSQQQTENKVTKTEVTRRTLSPSPVSPQATFPGDVSSRNSRDFMSQQDRRRRSVTSNMDWHKYIKQGQPWQDVYLHEHDTSHARTMSNSNDIFYTPDEPNDDSEESQWSPSYSWAPPRRINRDKYNRYLATGQADDELALERFYATPERESSEARRRLRRSKKQAEVLEHINRLMNVSSTSDLVVDERRRHRDRGSRRSRSHHHSTRDSSRDQSYAQDPNRENVREIIKRKAVGHVGASDRHPMDPLADLPVYPTPLERGGHHQRVSLSLDRELPVPKRDCSVHRNLSSDVKTHMRIAKDHKKHRKEVASRERSPAHQRWTGDGRRKTPLVLVSRSPREEPAPPDRFRPRSWSRSRNSASLLDYDMDSWADQWERKWEHERKQRPLTHWPAT